MLATRETDRPCTRQSGFGFGFADKSSFLDQLRRAPKLKNLDDEFPVYGAHFASSDSSTTRHLTCWGSNSRIYYHYHHHTSARKLCAGHIPFEPPTIIFSSTPITIASHDDKRPTIAKPSIHFRAAANHSARESSASPSIRCCSIVRFQAGPSDRLGRGFPAGKPSLGLECQTGACPVPKREARVDQIGDDAALWCWWPCVRACVRGAWAGGLGLGS
ncbi:hypothetical protein IWX91DRAFT_30881 [Phyllosticta citricarpa]